MGDFIDDIYYSEGEGMEAIRALLGSLFIICIMICCITCVYKYAQCQEKKDKKRTTYISVQSKFSQEV